MENVASFVHRWINNGRTIIFTWVGHIGVAPTRVYALAFTPEGKLLLVSGGALDKRWSPLNGSEV